MGICINSSGGSCSVTADCAYIGGATCCTDTHACVELNCTAGTVPSTSGCSCVDGGGGPGPGSNSEECEEDEDCEDEDCTACKWNPGAEGNTQTCAVITCTSEGCVETSEVVQSCQNATCTSVSDCQPYWCEECLYNYTTDSAEKACHRSKCTGASLCVSNLIPEPCEYTCTRDADCRGGCCIDSSCDPQTQGPNGSFSCPDDDQCTANTDCSGDAKCCEGGCLEIDCLSGKVPAADGCSCVDGPDPDDDDDGEGQCTTIADCPVGAGCCGGGCLFPDCLPGKVPAEDGCSCVDDPVGNTHTECNDQKQCITILEPGTSDCENHSDCVDNVECGNGINQDGEECDDGADNSDTEPDACREDCKMSWCGDGVLDTRELCDCGLGASASPQYCNTTNATTRYGDGTEVRCWSSSCNLAHYCGNEKVEKDGLDGQRGTADDEVCDDGNRVDGDGCTADCKREVEEEFGMKCENFQCVPDSNSTNNLCDDDFDCGHLGCQGISCELVVGGGGNTCNDSTTCVPDGKHTICDDGQCIEVDGEGDNGCTLEPNNCPPAGMHLECKDFTCQLVAGSGENTCTTDNKCVENPTCGNGIKEGDEECDLPGGNGEQLHTAGTEFCKITECNIDCTLQTCGDGTRNNPMDTMGVGVCKILGYDAEECDDGNTADGDGCSAVCLKEGVQGGTKCSNFQCVEDTTSDQRGCESDSECGHFECMDDSCVQVVGLGRNECNDDIRCGDPLEHTVCEDQQCISKFGPGTNACAGDSDCPPVGSHLACNNLQCKITLGNRSNTCSADEDCSGQSSSTIIAQSSSPQEVVIITDDDDDAGNNSGNNGRNNGNNNSGSVDDDDNLVASAPICGNGLIEEPEECDDRNRRDNDGCSSTCRSEVGVCGDGRVQTLLGEQCESSTHDPSLPYQCIECRFFSDTCRDGTLDDGEECDRGAQNSDEPNAKCRLDCSYPRCGDGTIDDKFQEECDDGNRRSGDGCDRGCKEEEVKSSAIVFEDSCGNGVLEAPEQCDDGNTENFDGCSDQCALQFGAPNTPLSPTETYVLSEMTGITVSQLESIIATVGPPPALGLYIAQNPQLLGLLLRIQPPEKAAKAAARIGIPPAAMQQVAFGQPRYPSALYQFPLAQLQPLIQSRGPIGDTGPAAVAVIGAGAAAGFGWMRRRRK